MCIRDRSGLEDGLLLFNADGRCVLGSPSLEKFLGVMPGTILGRRVGEIFSHGHPMRDALGLQGDHIEPVESAEVRLDSPNGCLLYTSCVSTITAVSV